MCTWCDKFSKRNFENKYFGFSRARWLSFYGERWLLWRPRSKYKNGFLIYGRSEQHEARRTLRGGCMRKGNGIFGNDRE